MTLTAMPLLREAGVLLRSLEGRPRIERMLRAILEGQAEPGRFTEDYRLTPHEFLLLCTADWLTALTPLGELEQVLLLQQFRPRLVEQVEQLQVATEGAALTALVLSLAEFRYATWPGYNEWWDTSKATRVALLPCPAVFALTLDINVLWFMSLRQLHQLRQGRSPSHAHSPDPPTDAPEATR